MKYQDKQPNLESENRQSTNEDTLNEVQKPNGIKPKNRWVKTLLLSSLSVVIIGVTGVGITNTINQYNEGKSTSNDIDKLRESFTYMQSLSLSMDSLEHEYVEDASVASTTAWTMKFQENINQIRETSKSLDSLSQEDKDKKVLRYKRILHSIADGYEMRLEGIKEQDMELIQRGSDLIDEAKAEMKR
ncbi:hypothetical protein [Rossellomorea marisflavi]|uniref:hypothetical protein n=1 Tax=Rossellomorea marisflavi TaxID=189381 RepID=UPI003F9F75BA